MNPILADKRYLLVTHVPFARDPAGAVVVDGLWALDLRGLAAETGRVRVLAPELNRDSLRIWGTGAVTLGPEEPLAFAGLRDIRSRRDLWKWPDNRRRIRNEVAAADLVHTSNFFPPWTGLGYAHRYAVRLGKKTLFVIAEDFHDMLEWEWVRTGDSGLARWRRARTLRRLDHRVRRTAATASLSFLHTPAAVQRYRLACRNAVAIRQPGHEAPDVIGETAFADRCARAIAGETLHLIAACRHKPLKGLDFALHALALLAARGTEVRMTLYGDGPMREDLVRLAQRLGVADRADLPGAIPAGAAVHAAIAAGHLFLMPHRTTDFGRAFFDGLAGGCPVIAFRTAASIDTVRDGIDGSIVPLDDVEALASAIGRYHEDRALLVRQAEAARQRALLNTRGLWYRLRADWTAALFLP